jgi:hypothetical protein
MDDASKAKIFCRLDDVGENKTKQNKTNFSLISFWQTNHNINKVKSKQVKSNGPGAPNHARGGRNRAV